MSAALPAGSGGTLITLFLAVIGAGGLQVAGGLLKDSIKARRRPAASVERNQSEVDASLLTVAKARDELEADNTTLRATLVEEREQSAAERAAHAAERAQWTAERASLMEQMTRLEERLRTERAESDARYVALLDEVRSLRTRSNEIGH